MKTTSVTLKTLTLAAAAAAFTLASPPAVNAVDYWIAPDGRTTIAHRVVHSTTGGVPEDVIIGWDGEEAIVDIVSGGLIECSRVGYVGHVGPGTVNVYEGGAFTAGHTIFVGENDPGYLNVLGGHVSSMHFYIGQIYGVAGSVTVVGPTATMNVSGELVVGLSDDGELVVSDAGGVDVSNLYIDWYGRVALNSGGALSADNLMTESGAQLFIGGNSLLSVSHDFAIEGVLEFTFAVSPAVTAGKIRLGNTGFIDFAESALTILAEGEFAFGDRILVLEGAPVDGLWGYDPIIADTGQVFDISYDELNAGVYETYLVARAIPEPSTYALIGGVGALALAMGARWRRRR
ncbi:MAG: PEP-CTERM sorting domain-containing protein [Puniceicoccales bacterium]|jgi:T5SS/PEP-CTERM-associated repeat protein|nr:PEP-CTERM sorting domain-containing protein [Puniceicoccales bacterium]